jgi:hypothetical protein
VGGNGLAEQSNNMLEFVQPKNKTNITFSSRVLFPSVGCLGYGGRGTLLIFLPFCIGGRSHKGLVGVGHGLLVVRVIKHYSVLSTT